MNELTVTFDDNRNYNISTEHFLSEPITRLCPPSDICFYLGVFANFNSRRRQCEKFVQRALFISWQKIKTDNSTTSISRTVYSHAFTVVKSHLPTKKIHQKTDGFSPVQRSSCGSGHELPNIPRRRRPLVVTHDLVFLSTHQGLERLLRGCYHLPVSPKRKPLPDPGNNQILSKSPRPGTLPITLIRF